MLEDIVEVKLKETDKVIHENPDEGFLVIRPDLEEVAKVTKVTRQRKKRKKARRRHTARG